MWYMNVCMYCDIPHVCTTIYIVKHFSCIAVFCVNVSQCRTLMYHMHVSQYLARMYRIHPAKKKVVIQTDACLVTNR